MLIFFLQLKLTKYHKLTYKIVKEKSTLFSEPAVNEFRCSNYLGKKMTKEKIKKDKKEKIKCNS